MRYLFTIVLLLSLWVSEAQVPYYHAVYPESWIATVKDVKYGISDTFTLDYYTVIPTLVTQNRPVLVIVPGSHFMKFNDDSTFARPKDAMRTMALKFAGKGYAVVVLDYQRYNDPCNPNEVQGNYVWYKGSQDIYAGLKFIAANASAYNLDMNNLFIYGQSAGGIAAIPVVFNSKAQLNSKLSEAVNLYGNIEAHTIGNNDTFNYTIKGIALQSTGFMTDKTLFTEADINTTIPMVVFHSLYDNTVPMYGHDQACYGKSWGGGAMFNVSNSSCKELFWDNSTTHSLRLKPYYGNTIDNICTNKFYSAIIGSCVNLYKVTNFNSLFAREGVLEEEDFRNFNWSQSTNMLHFGAGIVEGQSTIQIVDALGRPAYRGVIKEDQLDISSFNSGMYIVRIELSNGELISEKILK